MLMTKNPWMFVAAAVLLGAVGCRQREAPEQAQPVTQAQQQSEQALERAQEAQEEAREQREAAIGAREEVAEAQQDVREAQQEAEQERQQALEAQREAEQQAQAAQQQAQQAREQLAQQQQQAQEGIGAQPGMGAQEGPMLTVSGQVTAAQENSLLLRSQAGESVRLLINEDTQVLINGQQGEFTDIAEGAQVRASYRTQGEQEPTALRVEVMDSAMGGSGSEAQQQQQQQDTEKQY